MNSTAKFKCNGLSLFQWFAFSRYGTESIECTESKLLLNGVVNR